MNPRVYVGAFGTGFRLRDAPVLEWWWMRYSFISPQLALRLFYLSQHNVLGCCANCGQFRRLGRFSVWIWNVLQYCACPSIEVCLFVHSPNSALSAKDMLLWSSYLFSFFCCCALHIISKPWKMLTLIFFTHHSDKLLIMGNSRPWSTAAWMQFPMEMLSLWIKNCWHILCITAMFQYVIYYLGMLWNTHTGISAGIYSSHRIKRIPRLSS